MHLHATLLHCYIVWYALGPNLPGRSDREARLARWWKDDSGETGQDVETSKQDIFKVVIELTTFVSSWYLTPSNSRISTLQLKKIKIIILSDMLWILSHTRHIKMDKLTGNTWTGNSYFYFQFFNFVRKCYIYIAYQAAFVFLVSLSSPPQAAQAASAWPEDPCFTLVTTRPAWGAGCEHLNHPTMQYNTMW